MGATTSTLNQKQQAPQAVKQPLNHNHNQQQQTTTTAISYPHSLVYQVKLSSRDVQLDRVSLPQSKRIKEIVKGRSHYLVLTYDHIVYGWGTRHAGQLGSCGGSGGNSSMPLVAGQGARHGPGSRRSPGGSRRHTRSARNSLTASDLAEVTLARVSSDALTLPPPPPLPPTAHLSHTQPSSLASSTQTLAVGGSVAQLNQEANSLAVAAPTTRPFILGELNKRKIVRLAAGNDFSVFLSKTGIVMTCGDGSRGCLGRGDLGASPMPCMVDSLLAVDVAHVACGPEHVVAVCSKGQVFAWGNSRYGRLGLAPERISDGPFVALPQLVEFPWEQQQQQQRQSRRRQAASDSGEQQPSVIIKSAFCGDRCTVLIDSQHNCWACGENKFNRLGLDVRRRFKRTLLVEFAWRPMRVAGLAKHKIISCQLGVNHASYLTSEGRVLIYGQDIDLSYKLHLDLSTTMARSNCGLESRRGPGDTSERKWPQQLREPLRKLIARLLANDQLKNYKIKDKSSSKKLSATSAVSKSQSRPAEIARQQRRLIEVYLERSRSCKKMPFDCVLGTSCTRKFTLALTSDNRVYFWGARTHAKDDPGGLCPLPVTSVNFLNSSRHFKSRQLSIEPQLVGGVSSLIDESFIKIGATNSSLMSSIQLIGSDQPILHARNPQLRAASLADLWILDYKPPGPGSTDGSSRSSSSTSSLICDNHSRCSCSCCDSISCAGSSSCCSVESLCASSLSELPLESCSLATCQNTRPPPYGLQPTGDDTNSSTWWHRHDAILEPQPIVSLYVPPMYSYNNCLIQLVNLFCFDEDRFFLVLDTTVRLAPPTSNSTLAASSSSRPTSRRGSLSLKQLANTGPPSALAGPGMSSLASTLKQTRQQQLQPTGSAVAETTANNNNKTSAHWLNIVEEAKSSGESPPEPGKQQVPATGHSSVFRESDKSHNDDDDHELECCRGVAADGAQQRQREQDSLPIVLATEPDQQATRDATEGNLSVSSSCATSPSGLSGAHTALSLEEPRSMSTFAPSLRAPRHLFLARAPGGSPENSDATSAADAAGPAATNLQDEESEAPPAAELMRKLSFERSSHTGPFAPSYLLRRGKSRRQRQGRRGGRQRGNRSESTAVTLDDTSSMPTWVRNEYLQQLSSGSGASSPDKSHHHQQQQQPAEEEDFVSEGEGGETGEIEETDRRDETSEHTLTQAHLEGPYDAFGSGPQPMGSCSSDEATNHREPMGDSSKSSHSDCSLSTAIGREICGPQKRPGESLADVTRVSPSSSPSPSSSVSDIERDRGEFLRVSSFRANAGGGPVLSRSQSNVSTIDRQRPLGRAGQAADDPVRGSGPLDLEEGKGGRCSRMGENLLECSVYRAAVPRVSSVLRSSSSGGAESCQEQEEEGPKIPEHRHHLAETDFGGATKKQDDDDDDSQTTSQSQETFAGAAAGQRQQPRVLSQSAVCLPGERYVARLERSTTRDDAISHCSANNNSNNNNNNNNRHDDAHWHKRRPNKAASRASLTSIRKSLVRIFC